MTYRETLKDQLQRRKALNPRYSLRSLAKKLEISPSKLSEVLSGKKRLSRPRAEQIAQRLGLIGNQYDLFVLSAELEATTYARERGALQKQMQKLASQMNSERTQQRNAWYFGAVDALETHGHDAAKFGQALGLTDLQVENARRYRRRLQRHYPERTKIAIEPLSLLKKIEEDQIASHGPQIGCEFAFLSERQRLDLERKIRSMILTLKSDVVANEPKNLCLFFWGINPLVK